MWFLKSASLTRLCESKPRHQPYFGKPNHVTHSILGIQTATLGLFWGANHVTHSTLGTQTTSLAIFEETTSLAILVTGNFGHFQFWSLAILVTGNFGDANHVTGSAWGIKTITYHWQFWGCSSCCLQIAGNESPCHLQYCTPHVVTWISSQTHPFFIYVNLLGLLPIDFVQLGNPM